VALTGYGLPEDRRRSADAGFDVHLVKPVEPEQLAEVIGRELGEARR
jgi:CheY-like chemotaxis protein